MAWQLLIPAVTSILDKLIPDPTVAAEAKLKALELGQKGELAALDADLRLALGQIEVNKVEAESESIYKSGWRPAVGWTCAGGLFYQVCGRPLLGWAAINLWGWSLPPELEMETLMTLLFGLLGLGAYRSVEKIKKAS